MAIDLTEHTISVAAMIKIMTPVVSAMFFGAGWVIKRTVGKLDDGLAAVVADVDRLAADCRAEIAQLRRECRECVQLRTREREDTIDTYGKFGSRLTRIETEHNMHHRGGTSV